MAIAYQTIISCFDKMSIYLITFGLPRAGNKPFRNEMLHRADVIHSKVASWRIVYSRDPVARVPMRIRQMLRHVPREIWYPPEKYRTICPDSRKEDKKLQPENRVERDAYGGGHSMESKYFDVVFASMFEQNAEPSRLFPDVGSTFRFCSICTCASTCSVVNESEPRYCNNSAVCQNSLDEAAAYREEAVPSNFFECCNNINQGTTLSTKCFPRHYHDRLSPNPVPYEERLCWLRLPSSDFTTTRAVLGIVRTYAST